jgi:formate dehydrogenase subunit delta
MAPPPHVRLANEIAVQFAHVPAEQGAAYIATHLAAFWEPRMLRALSAHVRDGGGDLDPLVVLALDRLPAGTAR